MATGPALDSSSFPAEIGSALRQALIAGYGPDAGAAAAQDAITWAAAHPERLGSMENPTAHLFRIGRRRARWNRERPRRLPEVPDGAAPWIGSAVPQILLSLPRQQRTVVLLRHGFGWSESKMAGVLVADDSVIRRADSAGMAKLRSGLDLGDDASERTLHNQIAAYAEVLDKAAPQLEELTAEEGDGKLSSIRWQAGPFLTTFVVGMLVIGGALIVRSNRSPATVDVVDGSSTTAVAAALPAVDAELVNRSAITPEMFPTWDYRFAGPGAVTVVDGRYHMLSAAYGDDVATVAYAVSDDGVVWSQAEDYPVLDLSEAPWAPLEIDQAVPRSVIVDRDGSWQLFFDVVWYDRGADEIRASIGRVVARDPAGTWIFDSAPIITRNDAHPWMAERVSSPSVVVRDDRLVMLFVGEGPEGGVVGFAESQHGAVWSVRPKPAYSGSGNWDGGTISRVDLMVVPGGMAMFYAGESANRRGLAISEDGVGWAPHASNPLLTVEDVSAAALFDTEFVPEGTDVLAFVENGQPRGPREVAVLRLTLDIANLIDALPSG